MSASSSPLKNPPGASEAKREAAPGIPPLIPVMAPIVAAALVLGLVFSRYSAQLSPARTAPPVRFTDVTLTSGIDFTHSNGASFEAESPTTLGSGAAVIDYNNDGRPDLFFVNGTTWPWDDEAEGSQRSALFRNEGEGRFSDVTGETNAGVSIQGMGVSVGDYDADGWLDLFLTGVGDQRLLRNLGTGQFEDVTERAGLSNDGHSWTTGSLWLDLDGDRDLDLIVCQYLRWPKEIELETAFKIAGVGRSYGAPAGFIGASPLVYENVGDGTFVQAAERFGLRNLASDTRLPRSGVLGVAPTDLNGDNAIDLAFVYHGGEPTLYLKDGSSFREWNPPGIRQEGAAAGLVAMGALPVGRNRDGASVLEAARVAASAQATALQGQFVKLPAKLGVARMDYDLDGRIDVFSGGATAEPDVNRFDAGRRFDGVPSLFWNGGEGWENIGVLGSTPTRMRGVVTLDLDADGDEDVVLTQNYGPAVILRNDQRQSSAWLRVKLVGKKVSADGAGARVELHTPRQKLSRLALPAVGYLSQSESVMTFGLGEDARVRRMVIQWPSGVRQEIAAPAINQVLTVVEPD